MGLSILAQAGTGLTFVFAGRDALRWPANWVQYPESKAGQGRAEQGRSGQGLAKVSLLGFALGKTCVASMTSGASTDFF